MYPRDRLPFWDQERPIERRSSRFLNCSSDGPGMALPVSSQQFKEGMGEKVDVGVNGNRSPR